LKTAIYRKEHFNAAHRLFNPDWSFEKNEEVFGKCNNINYHGHNYEIVLKVIGEINPDTGYVFDTKILSNLLKEHVIKRYDHKNLNLECPEFVNVNPTAENIAKEIYNRMRPLLDSTLEIKVFLYETERNFVEYPAN
jgi:6-pyruvoyltetrahydropterin/6-carboxytetrahydropterin synthase